MIYYSLYLSDLECKQRHTAIPFCYKANITYHNLQDRNPNWKIQLECGNKQK